MSNGGFSGRFKMEVRDAYTNKLTKVREFDNIVVNNGLHIKSKVGLGNEANVIVGTGTKVPAATDTDLDNRVAISSTSLGMEQTSNKGAPDYITSGTSSCRFNAGTFDGTTLTEVGIKYAYENGIFCRALILDEEGKPSSITVLKNEYLDVTYTIEFHPDLSEYDFTFKMNNVTYECHSKPALVAHAAFGQFLPMICSAPDIKMLTAYTTQELGDIDKTPGGEWMYGAQSTVKYVEHSDPFTRQNSCFWPLDPGSYYSDGLTNGNLEGGVGSFILGTGSVQAYHNHIFGAGVYRQVSVNPKIPKDDKTEMTFMFSYSVDRYTHPTT